MPYKICKMLEVENGHMLAKHPDDCQYPHGHSRKVEIVLEADELDKNDMVCDFKIVKTVIRDYVMKYDHAICMNTKDPHYKVMKAEFGDKIIDFEDTDPTTEVIAKEIYDVLKRELDSYKEKGDVRYPLSPDVKVVSVKLWETSSSWAEYGE